jgi:hypothetical protein
VSKLIGRRQSFLLDPRVSLPRVQGGVEPKLARRSRGTAGERERRPRSGLPLSARERAWGQRRRTLADIVQGGSALEVGTDACFRPREE